MLAAVRGDCDLATESRLRGALMEVAGQRPGCVVVDVAGVDFLAAAAVHVLMDVSAALAAWGGRLVVACAQPIVARVLSLTGADAVVAVVGSVDEAVPGVSQWQDRARPDAIV